MNHVYEATAHVTEYEAAMFEDNFDEYVASVSGASEVEDDAVKLMAMEIAESYPFGVEAESAYKVVNLIGKFTSPNGNWGITTKNLGC